MPEATMTEILCVGHAVEDHVFRVGEIPTTAAKHRASGVEIVGGGPAANAAVAIARLGGRVRLAARVGDDSVGGSIIRDLEAEGVDCALVRKLPGAQSSRSAVMVADNGERMIVNYLDPDLPDDPAWLEAALPTTVRAVLADARWPRGALCALNAARRLGVPGVLDADYPAPADAGALVRAASHAAFSAQGLRAYANDDDLERAVIRVAADTRAWCCVTDGADGVFIAGLDRCAHLPAAKVAAADTLGAGDVWHGAFVFALARRRAEQDAERDAAHFANAAAALKVTRPGGRRGAPSLAEVETFLKRSNAAA